MCVFSCLIHSTQLRGVRMADLPRRFDWVTFPMMVLQSEAVRQQNKGYCRVHAWGLGGMCVCVSCVPLCYSDYGWQVDSCDIWWLWLLIFSEAQVVCCVPHWHADHLREALLIYPFSIEASCCPLFAYNVVNQGWMSLLTFQIVTFSKLLYGKHFLYGATQKKYTTLVD